MNQREPDGVSTSERRRHTRTATESGVRIRLEPNQIEGTASNISKSGILFFTDEQVRVTVEITDHNGTQTYQGHLVRSERIKGNHRGWAVEFEGE